MNNSKSNYWMTRPLKVDNNFNEKPYQIISNEELLIKVQNDINKHPYKLLYTINEPKDLNIICEFINKNYTNDENIKSIYKTDIIKYYMKDALILCFYPKKNKIKSKMIGLIIAKKTKLMINQLEFNSVETNFLSIEPKFRGKNIAPLIISILTKELILQYSIGISHYTINNPIKSPHYCLKYYFHRMINIKNLFDTNFIDDEPNKLNDYIKIYNHFDNYLPEQHIIYFNKKITQKISDDLINLIYLNINSYSKYKYKIYEHKTFEQIKDLFDIESFHHFLFIETNEKHHLKIKNYICLNQIDILNINTNLSYSNGYIYMGFYENNLDILIEKLTEYVWKIKLFDLITWTDFFNISNSYSKAVKGTGFLKYYLFNIKTSVIPYDLNGLITL